MAIKRETTIANTRESSVVEWDAKNSNLATQFKDRAAMTNESAQEKTALDSCFPFPFPDGLALNSLEVSFTFKLK